MSYQSQWDDRKQDILDAANRVKDQNPGAWEEVKVPGQPSRRFISLVAAECQRTVSVEVGCNAKRGGPEVSLDVLAMPNPSGCRDATGTYPGLELRDIIGGAEGPNPSIIWGDATQATIDSGNPGGWIKTVTTPGPPPSSCVFPPQNETFDFGTALNAKYKTDRHAPLIGTDNEGVALYVNLKGMAVWLQDYLRLRTAGKSHAEAQAEVFRTIDQIP